MHRSRCLQPDTQDVSAAAATHSADIHIEGPVSKKSKICAANLPEGPPCRATAAPESSQGGGQRKSPPKQVQARQPLSIGRQHEYSFPFSPQQCDRSNNTQTASDSINTENFTRMLCQQNNVKDKGTATDSQHLGHTESVASAGVTSQSTNLDGVEEEVTVAVAVGNSNKFITKKKSAEEVVQWLSSHLPSLRRDDALHYCAFLIKDGFDSLCVLASIEAEDLSFMKKAHQRSLIKKLANSS